MTIKVEVTATGPVAILVVVVPMPPRKAAPRSVPPFPVARVIEASGEAVDESLQEAV